MSIAFDRNSLWEVARVVELFSRLVWYVRYEKFPNLSRQESTYHRNPGSFFEAARNQMMWSHH